MMMRIRVIQRRTRGRFALTPALWGAYSLYRPVQNMAVRKCSKRCQIFRVFHGRAFSVQGDAPMFLQTDRRGRGKALVSCLGGWLFWNIMAHPLLGEEDNMRRHRAGFEPQRSLPFRKRLKPQVF
jgi:hypothetical protein